MNCPNAACFAGAAENIFNFSKDKFLQGEYNLMQHKGSLSLQLLMTIIPVL